MPDIKRVLKITGWVLFIGFLIQCLFDPLAPLMHQIKLNRLQRELNEAKSRWESANIRDYSFELRQWFWLIGPVCHAKITVNHGEIVKMTESFDALAMGLELEPLPTSERREGCGDPPYSRMTIPEMFDKVQWYIDQKTNITSLVFDLESGFLIELRGDDNFNKGFLVPKMFDSGFLYILNNFQILDSSTP